MVDKLIQQNPIVPQLHKDVKPAYPLEKNQIVALTTSVSLKVYMNFEFFFEVLLYIYHRIFFPIKML